MRPFFFMTQRFRRLLQTLRLAVYFSQSSKFEESQYALANYFMKNPLGVWVICLQGNQEMIGSINLKMMNQKRSRNWLLLKAILVTRVRTEVVTKLCQLSFEEFGLKQLSIITIWRIKLVKSALKSGFNLVRQV